MGALVAVEIAHGAEYGHCISGHKVPIRLVTFPIYAVKEAALDCFSGEHLLLITKIETKQHVLANIWGLNYRIPAAPHRGKQVHVVVVGETFDVKIDAVEQRRVV